MVFNTGLPSGRHCAGSRFQRGRRSLRLSDHPAGPRGYRYIRIHPVSGAAAASEGRLLGGL